MSPVTNFPLTGSKYDISNGVRSVFVTGTDTDVGKTVFAGLLGRYLLIEGVNVITQKWIQSGSKKSRRDIDTHLKLMQKKRKDIKEYLPYIEPYIFRFPASPHLAANLEKKKINIDKIKKSYRFLLKKFDFVIVESVGGALVPINRKKLVIDIARDLKMPVVIVVGNKLGAINHTLLTVEAIRRRKMNIAGLIFNNIDSKVDKIILEDNIRIIKKITGEKVLGVLPWISGLKRI